MKKAVFISLFFLTGFCLFAQKESAYYEVGALNYDLNKNVASVMERLENAGFKVIGQYFPGNSGNLAVVCYTHPELEKIALEYTDRGALGATLKIGFKKNENVVKVSMLNPMYIFYAYFVNGIEKHESALKEISNKAKSAMQSLSGELKPFGGTLEKAQLQKYRYKVMMPYFTDAEKINEFDSFENGVKTIRDNLSARKGSTEKVFELIYPDKKVAVFGVGLKNENDGEDKFLPIIGSDHVAAMPYEIILQGTQATILPGRYRIALHWPELTMGTFMKIMSTPGDIKNTLEGLTK